MKGADVAATVPLGQQGYAGPRQGGPAGRWMRRALLGMLVPAPRPDATATPPRQERPMTRRGRPRGDDRPRGAAAESVWDYPRPPRVEPDARRVRVELAGRVICDTGEAVRVLETSHPPTWYLPREAFAGVELRPSARRTTCEFKGTASYLTLVVGDREERDAAWSYDAPRPGYEALAGRLCVYPSRVDACWVDDERVTPQEGDFYGGWITSDVVGPFKGGPGTIGW